ncbi:MAG: Asp-tRNA(Asn)/Glu-tRNA(Gln) amidotransferase subunit GatC [Planctomycetota bacterium]
MADEVTREQVEKLARLSKLEIEPGKAAELAGQLSGICGYAQRLGELDLQGVEPLAHAADLDAPLAEDEAGGELDHAALVRIAPAMDGRFIRVPRVLGG